MSYEQDILNQHSSPRLRRAVLDNPPEPEVPWHEYPVPTHYKVFDGQWQIYDHSQRPTIYVLLKYSDGSIRGDGDWGITTASTPHVPWKPHPGDALL